MVRLELHLIALLVHELVIFVWNDVARVRALAMVD